MDTDLRTFRERLKDLSRSELLSIIHDQDPQLIKGIERTEWVFANKLQHLTWPDGGEITGKPFTNQELALLVDEPFQPDRELTKLGISIDQQREIHIAKDPVLWAKYFLGLEPRVYQIMILRHPSLRKVLRAGRRAGKALSIDTPIPTPDGWTTMKELEVGARVFDEHGKPCNVTMVTDVQWNRQCYNVHFSDGEVLIADADHQWLVDTKRSRKARGRAKNPQSFPETLTTRDMINNLYVWSGDKFEVNYSIEIADPVEYPEKDLPIDPYVLGIWLGDGLSVGGSITVGQDDIETLDNIETLGYEIKHWESSPIQYNIIGLAIKLKKLGVRCVSKTNKKNAGFNKHIPLIYLQGSIAQRDSLLQGLMDSDGTVNGEGRGAVEFSVCDEVLARDAWELIKSLGYRCTFRTAPEMFYGEQIGWRYRIGFTPWKPVFRLKRKLNLQKLSDKPTARTRCRYIVAIEETESVPVKCISVDSPNSLYLAGRNFIPTHNTYSMSIAMLHYAYTHEFGRVLVVTPMKSQGQVIYDELIRMVKLKDAVWNSLSRHVTSPNFEVGFTNNSTIKFFTSGMKSGGRADVVRGQEAHLIVLDELDYMHPNDLDSIYVMLTPTSEDQESKLLIGASTPTGQRTTPFYKWCNNPQRFKEFWVPSYANPMFTKEIEEEFRAQYSEMAYRHEIEADWGEDTEGVYARKYVDASIVRPGWEYKTEVTSARSFFIFGVDWDKYGAGTNIVVLEVCQDNYEIEELQGKIRIAFREETPKDEFSYTEAVKRIIELNGIFHPKHVYVDRGAGEVQVELLMKYGIEHPESGLRKSVKGVQFSETIEVLDPGTKQPVKKDLKPFMVSNLSRFLEKDVLRFPEHDETLYMQLTSYVVDRMTAAGRPVFMAGGDTEDHIHDALILACLAITQNYDDLMRVRLARHAIAISRDAFQPLFTTESDTEREIAVATWGSESAAPVAHNRSMTVSMSRSSKNRPIKRSSF